MGLIVANEYSLNRLLSFKCWSNAYNQKTDMTLAFNVNPSQYNVTRLTKTLLENMIVITVFWLDYKKGGV